MPRVPRAPAVRGPALSSRDQLLGRPNPNFEKRAREKKKLEKRAEKARRKAERESAKKLGPTPETEGTDSEGNTEDDGEPPGESDESDKSDESESSTHRPD